MRALPLVLGVWLATGGFSRAAEFSRLPRPADLSFLSMAPSAAMAAPILSVPLTLAAQAPSQWPGLSAGPASSAISRGLAAPARPAGTSRGRARTETAAARARRLFDGSGISGSWVEEMLAQAPPGPAQRRLADDVQRLGFKPVATNRAILQAHNERYTLELPQGTITDQKQSGRCWIFAGLNMIRSMMLEGPNTPRDLELSENYLHFFNMLEKAKDHLDEAAELAYGAGRKRRGRRRALAPEIDDGGFYEYFAFLVSKYGLVPKSAMGETISSQATATLIGELETSLAQTTTELLADARRGARASGRRALIMERGMRRVWRILATHLGAPPRRFSYRQDRADKKLVKGVKRTRSKLTSMTPRRFASKIARFDPADYVVVASYPGKRLDTVYEIPDSAIGAARRGRPSFDLRFLNVSPQTMRRQAAEAIRGGQAVWFAADIGQDVDHASGIMHPELFDRDGVYNFPAGERSKPLSRRQRAYYHLIGPSHAMLLTGLDEPEAGKLVKFKVENSWGDKYGSRGVYHLYPPWFDQYVFEIVVHRRFLSRAQQRLWDGKARRARGKL
ncbi:MAG: hypothetical protein KGO96_09495 [Elusimicrobia bacterium]|nr:hypothetical protein [Elusimicrobiota bacterium]MDE2237253.1 hypothetical protein [Elusimicrobiota bacterium]MDE2426122.1 hypothetical protein [Elusimicrobiota bacterium]